MQFPEILIGSKDFKDTNSAWSLRDQVPGPLVPQEKSLNYTLPCFSSKIE